MTAGRNSTSGGTPPPAEDFVPTPPFSGHVQFFAPNAISFAPATTKFATPMTNGTLMVDFLAEPEVLRDWDDMFLTDDFTLLVITWPGLEELRVSMASMIGGRYYVSREELAQFVVDQFNLLANIMGDGPLPSQEWRFGEAPDACNVKNTSLAFLWSPAPGVWQPAFRSRNRHQLHNIKTEPSTPQGISET